MKKIILLLLVLFWVQAGIAQSYKIMNAASGSLENFEALHDGNELYGYAELRKLDIENPLQIRYKYIILDRNMNTVCSGEFSESLVKKKCYKESYQVLYNKGHVMFTFREVFNSGKNLMPVRCTYKILDIAANKITADEVFDTTLKGDESAPKLYMRYKNFIAEPISDIGFTANSYGGTVIGSAMNVNYYAIGFDSKKIWDQDVKAHDPKYYYEYYLLDKDNDILTLIATYKKDMKKVSDHLMVLDARTGKEISFTDLFNAEYTLRFSYSKLKNNELTIVGRYFKKDKRDKVDYDESLGLYKRVIDVKSGKILSDKFLPYSQFKSLDIDENGKVKKEGYLAFREIDQCPDGSFFLLAETYRSKSGGDIYTELYTFILDKDFNLKDIKSFDTGRTRGSKYSFYQDLPNNHGKVYFFYNKDKEKKTQINMINNLYSNNSVTVNTMSVDTENSIIRVMPAKTGYLGIVEYFKNAKKGEQEVELRLEKINYERE